VFTKKTVRARDERAATNEGRRGELSMTFEKQPDLDRPVAATKISLRVHVVVTGRKRPLRTLAEDRFGPGRSACHRETTMRTVLRNLIERTRRISGNGAVRNAHLEVENTSRSVVELDRQLKRVCDRTPRQAA